MYNLKIVLLLTVGLISTLQAGDTPTGMVEIRIVEKEQMEDERGNRYNVRTEIFVPKKGVCRNLYDAYRIKKNLSPDDKLEMIFAGKTLAQDLEYTEEDTAGKEDFGYKIHARITYSPLINELRRIGNTQNSSAPSTTLVENLKNYSISSDE